MTSPSYLVHLASLTDFARELETQVDGLTRPTSDLAALASAPLRPGDFAEAQALAAAHAATVSQMSDLLGQVRQVIAFAGEVTHTVAGHYERADGDVAAALGTKG